MMLKIRQLHLKVFLDGQDCKKLKADLSQKYDLLIEGMKGDYFRRLELPEKQGNSSEWDIILEPGKKKLLGGDLIYQAPGAVIYYKVPKDEETIEIGSIGDVPSKVFRQFANDIKLSILDALDDPNREWVPVKRVTSSFQLLANESAAVFPSEAEILSATEIRERSSLDLLNLLNRETAIQQDKLTESAGVENAGEILSRFSNLGLTTAEFILLCNRTGQQILKVPNKSALMEISQKGFKCFLCGSSISEEKLVQTISVSDFGKKLLTDNYWLTVLALNSLNNLGIPFEENMVHTGEKGNTGIFLQLNDESMMIQLYDRKLNIEDTYLIGAYITAYDLKYVLLVSTQPVSELMKGHLTRNNPACNLGFIENLEDLTRELNDIIFEKERNRIESILSELDELTPINLDGLIMKKLMPAGKTIPNNGLEDLVIPELKPRPRYQSSAQPIAPSSVIPEMSQQEPEPSPQPAYQESASIFALQEPEFPLQEATVENDSESIEIPEVGIDLLPAGQATADNDLDIFGTGNVDEDFMKDLEGISFIKPAN